MSLSEDPSLERATVSEHYGFMQAVGSIQYIFVVTRPDLAFLLMSWPGLPTGVTTSVTSRHGVRRDSTWAQGQVPAWTEYS